MSSFVTAQQIIDNARIMCDQRDKSFITDAEAMNLLSGIYGDLYDEMISIDDNYFINDSYNFAIANGVQEYSLPADFYKVVGVDFQSNPGSDRITIYRYNEGERNVSFTANNNIPTGTVYMSYIPVATPITTLTQTVDGVSGWDRLLSLRLAVDMADAEETNTDRLERKYQQTLERIRGALQRDQGMPSTITDTSRPSVQYLYSTLKYRLYGNNIKFISTQWLGSVQFGGPFM